MDKLFTKGKATAGHTNVFVTPELGFFLKLHDFYSSFLLLSPKA